MADDRTITVTLPAHLVEMLGLAPHATLRNRQAGADPMASDEDVAAALLRFLERHHDQHFGASAERAEEERRAEQEREWLEDPDRSVGGGFAPDYFKR